MPVHIKLIVTALALMVVGGFAYSNLGVRNDVAYAGFALAAFMVVAMWVFPETGNSQPEEKPKGS